MNLQKLCTKSQELALRFHSSTPQSLEFQELLTEFLKLQNHNDPQLQKIGRLALIFQGQWTERQWLNLLVPLERYLDRRGTDAEWMGALPDRPQRAQEKIGLQIIADHWRSAFNVGSLFRLADGFGVNRIYLTGYTPTPAHPSVQKTALGSIDQTPWTHHTSTMELIAQLQSEGQTLWALETSSTAQILGSISLPSPLTVILGNERFGLDPQVLNKCEGILQIPLRGLKNSLNVAQCASILAFEWCRQHAL